MNEGYTGSCPYDGRTCIHDLEIREGCIPDCETHARYGDGQAPGFEIIEEDPEGHEPEREEDSEEYLERMLKEFKIPNIE